MTAPLNLTKLRATRVLGLFTKGVSVAVEKTQKRYLSHDEFLRLADKVAAMLRRRRFDHCLLVSRGGLSPGGYLAKCVPFYDILVASIMWYKKGRKLARPVILQFPPETLLNGRRVLIIDDVWDSGDTLDLVRHMCIRAGAKVRIATLHYKPRKSTHPGQPDFFAEETEDWIVYPWEVVWTVHIEESGVRRGTFVHEFDCKPRAGKKVVFDRPPHKKTTACTFVFTSVDLNSHVAVLTPVS